MNVLQDLDMRPLRERISDLDIDNAATLEEASQRLYLAGLTDGLPVVPPTSARVEAMLSHCEMRPDLAVDAVLPPAFVAPTLRDVAVNAGMAGSEASYLPVIVSALRAMADPSFNLLGIQTTTGSATPLLIVSGPAAAQLNINAGSNCMGQGSRANATIGRAIRLILQNVALAIPGIGDMATQGQPGKYTWCLAENVRESPWLPLHVDEGFSETESTVAVVGASGIIEVMLGSGNPGELVSILTSAMAAVVGLRSRGMNSSGQILVLLPPECAQILSSNGWDRARLQQAIFNEAQVPLSGLEHDQAEYVLHRQEQLGFSPTEAVSVTHSPRDILIVVAGGTGIKANIVPTWGGGTRAVTRSIEPV